ncbi:MAG TPA: cadherin domain-containing protein [Thermoanaerobaculia bacterium]
MKINRRIAAPMLALLFALAVPTLASAATSEFSVLINVDPNASPVTGCSVTEAGQTMHGVDQMLIATVTTDATTGTVTNVVRRVCAGGAFGAPIAVEGGWDAGLKPANGEMLVEMRMPLSALPGGELGPKTQLGFIGRTGSSTHVAFDLNNDAPILYPAGNKVKKRSVRPYGSHNIVLDGKGEDWGNIDQLAEGIASGGSQTLRIFKAFAYEGASHLFFRLDARLNSSSPIAIDDHHTVTPGGTLTVPDRGVLENDIYEGEGPLTAELVAPPSSGTVSLSPAGGFTYENTQPAATDDSFQYQARAGSQVSNTATVHIAISGAQPNQAPALDETTFSVAENSPNGTVVGTVTASDPNAGQTLTFAITGGNTNGAFAIDASTGVITVANSGALDAESFPSFSLTVTVTDNGTPQLSDSGTIGIGVNDVNEAPFVNNDNFTLPENSANGTTVGTVTGGDPDAGQTITFAITAGNTNGAFAINATTGVITVANSGALDYETTATFFLTVEATDNGGSAMTGSGTIGVTLTNVNEAPAVSPATFAVNENAPNGTLVGTATRTDVDGPGATWSITNGNTNGAFAINPATGAITVANSAALDFETTSSFALTVQVSDGGTPNLSDTEVITINVNDVNEAPVVTAATFPLAENTPNGTAVGTVTATDPDGHTLTFAITGGNTNGAFAINGATGQITVANSAALDFETTPVFSLTVSATDNGAPVLSASNTITINLTDVNDAPVITSAASANVPENTNAVLTVTATDQDGQTVTYSITGGADAADFVINPVTGVLTFALFPNFEAPADADANNIYLVQVTATDGTSPVNQTITVTVTNVNEPPAITSLTSFLVPENTTAVTTVTASDEDGDTITWSITGGADAGDFSINAATGALVFNVAPNFEAPADADANNSYLVEVTANDGTNTASQTIAVSVTDVNEAPVITSGNAFNVAENTTAVATVTSTDPEGQVVTYSITGGADAGAFSINAATGALTFNAAPNFEAPADADANNIYLVQVTATDGVNPVNQTVTVTVTNTNEAPVITSANTATVPENTLVATTVTTTDPEGNAITYSITGGADQALFSIDGSTGVLSFNAPPDFENPSDADSNNQYLVQVTATDGTTPVNQTITVTVTDVNEAPEFTSADNPSVVEGNTAVTTVTTTDPEGNTVTYSITGGADQALFSINASTGALTFNAAPDFEAPADADANNTYLVQVTANDGTNNSNQTLTVTVTNANEGPAFTSSNAASVPENTTAVLTVTATDPEGDTLTYSITGGADAGAFTINTSTGALSFLSAPNFEAPADAGANNVYDVQITATDGTTPVNQTIAVTVTDVNEAPSITSSNAASVPENTTAVTTVTTTDPEGNTITYSITGGADAALFSIDSSTGALTFNAAPDYEAPADADTNNSYIVQVTATDGTTPVNQTVTVTVTDANEAPSFTSGATPSVVENTTAVTTVTATDPEGNTLTYSITGGADQALFSINTSTGALSFLSAPNFEAPADAGANNVYDVQVTATDGTNPVVQNLSVTVTDANEAPSITSSNAASVAENTTAVTTVTTTDPEGDTITYSITGGADQALFTINSSTGALSFLSAPDFEAPADAGANNVYDVQVTATDGTNPVNQTIAVTVTNVDEAPAFSSSPTPSVPENTTAVTTVTAADPEGNTLTYSITGGADQALFSINSSTGVLTFNSAQNYEAPADADTDRFYLVDVTATDGTTPVVQNLIVEVTNVNEAPSVNAGFTTINVNENTTAVATITATDPDGSSPTFSIVGGADAALFSINSTTGALTFNAAPNFEAPADAGANNAYELTVRASDGTLFSDESITVNVQNVDEQPVFTSTATPSVPEHTTDVVFVAAVDPESATVTYSITGGADQALFGIDNSTGELRFLTGPDFEAPTDADTNNVYLVQVTANDGTTTATQNIAVTVTDANDPPVFTSSGTPSVPENTTAVITVVAADPEAAAVTYSLAGGADQALFSINSTTGALAFLSAPNFEAPADADTNNVYEVQVAATDGIHVVLQSLSVTVTNANEAPSITSANNASVPENSVSVLTVTSTDPDGNTVTYSITGGADAAAFSINATTGVLTFSAPPDYEAPIDSDGNNVYEVEVTATDGTNPVTQTITVTVTPVDEGPAFTSTATPSVPENTTAVVDVDATDPEGSGLTFSITGGADQAAFSIDSGTGVLTFNVAPNFEAPTDADTNNTYLVDVTATDGTNPVVQSLTVTVTDVNEAPSFTSSATPSVPENTTAVITVTAVDPDATTPTYSITGGADAALFSINGTTGALTFNAAPNFEAPADADANNTYLVDVTATDGTNPVVQSLTVTVTNVDEAPAFTSANSASVAENTAASFLTVAATDPEGATVTYSITGGADQGDFSINSTTGELTFAATPNFEAPADADANNIYLVQVTATDGTNPVNQTVTVTVTNVNEAPVNTVPAAQATLEDTNRIFSSGNGNQISISDPDGDVTVQVTLSATNGTLSTNGITGLSFTVGDGTDDPTLTFTGTVSNINARLNGLTFKPNLNYYSTHPVSTDLLSITTDDQGNSGSGGALQDSDSIGMDVDPVNDKPTTASYTIANGNAHGTHSGIGITITAAHSNELKEDSADVDDHDPYSELTVQIVGGTLSPANATLTLIDASTGAFYFEPPGGIGADDTAPSFQYQVCDNGDVTLGLAAQCSDPATVQVVLTGADTWFVDDTDAAGCGISCNGARTKPLVGLNSVALAGRGTGDRVFAFSGTYNHGFTMAASERLIGQASTSTFDGHFGVVVPANGTLDSRPAMSGAAVTLQNTVTAANNTLLRGITITSGANKGYVSPAGATTLTVLESSVTSTGNMAIDVAGATNAATSVAFTSTNSSGGTRGVSLDGVNGTWSLGTGALNNNTQAAFYLQNANASTITYGGTMAPTTGRAVLIGTADGNSAANASNGLEAGSTVTLSGNMTAGGIGVYESSGGTLNFNAAATHTFNTGATNAVELIDNNGTTFNYNVANLTITTVAGKGFHASQGGTVNLTGANNVVTSGNGLVSGSGGGIAVEVVGTSGEHMAGTLNWKTVNASFGTKGFSAQFFDGPVSITGTDGGDAGTDGDAGTGGTINTMTNRGVELTNITGAISVQGMNINNGGTTNGVAATTCGDSQAGDNSNCNAAIHVLSATTATTLAQLSINGGAQMGINTRNVTNLVMRNLEVQNVGNETMENGAMLVNTFGTGSITNGNFHDNESRQVHMYNATGTLSSFTIKGSNFANSDAPNGNFGLVVEASGAATNMNVVAGGVPVGEGNTFSNLFSYAWIATSSNNAALTAHLIGSTVTNCHTAAVAQASLSSTMNVRIEANNTVSGVKTGAGPINLKTDGGGNMNAVVWNNTIGQNGVAGSGTPTGCGNCPGMYINPRFGGTSSFDIRGNTIQNVDGPAIAFQPGESTTQNINAVITGNLIRQPVAGDDSQAISIVNGVTSVPADSGCLAVQLGGNVAWTGSPTTTANVQNRIEGDWAEGLSSKAEVLLAQRFSTTFKLVNYLGAGVAAYVNSQNSITSATPNVTTLGTISGGTACP